MDWTAAEVGAHVATMIRRYAGNPARAADRDALRAQNLGEVESFGADAHAAAQAIDDQIVFLGSIAGGLPLDAEFPFHLGLTVTTGQGWANLLSEFLVHGDDVSRATGRPWAFRPRPSRACGVRCCRCWPAGFALRLATSTRSTPSACPSAPCACGCAVESSAWTTATARPTTRSPWPIRSSSASRCPPWRRRAVTDPHAAVFLTRFYDI